jgi:hypothetical protein
MKRKLTVLMVTAFGPREESRLVVRRNQLGTLLLTTSMEEYAASRAPSMT